MAVPTFTSITPSSMVSRARSLVTIEGTNFREPDPAPATGQTTAGVQRTVSVTIGGEPARDVLVYDDTFLTCVAPDWRGSVNQANDPLPAAVDVVITNLDNAGVAIPGETVTAAGAFTYTRRRITADRRSWLNQVIRALIDSFKRNVIFNTTLNKHTESYDLTSGTLRLLDLGKLPGLSLSGPDLRMSAAYTNQHNILVTSGPTTLDERRRHYVVDLEFDILGFSDRSDELANLIQSCAEYVHGHGILLVDPDPTSGETERREYDMHWAPNGEPRATGSANTSNLKVFTSRLVVRGVDLETGDILRRHYIRDDSDPTLEVEKIVV